jgi:hypothetical protein
MMLGEPFELSLRWLRRKRAVTTPTHFAAPLTPISSAVRVATFSSIELRHRYFADAVQALLGFTQNL